MGVRCGGFPFFVSVCLQDDRMGFNRVVRVVLSRINHYSLPLRGRTLVLFEFRRLLPGICSDSGKSWKLYRWKHQLPVGILRSKNAWEKTADTQ